MEYLYSDTPVFLETLNEEIKSEFPTNYRGSYTEENNLHCVFDVALDETALNGLDTIVTNHSSNYQTSSEFAIYNISQSLLEKIDPWVENFLRKTRAENIAMGITQAGKTYEAQAFFENQIYLYPMSLPGKSISMLGALYTGSLTLIPALVDYYVANPTTYSGLSPFVTEARLLAWKQEVIDFLTGG